MQGEFVFEESKQAVIDPEITVHKPEYGLESITIKVGVPFRLVWEAIRYRVMRAVESEVKLYPEEIDKAIIELESVDDSAFEDGDSGLKITVIAIRRVALAEDAPTAAVQKSLIDSAPVLPIPIPEEDYVPF